MKIKDNIPALLVIIIISSGVHAFSQSKSLPQTALEIELAQRAETMIEKIVGKERALVKVKITLSTPKRTSATERAVPLRNLTGVIPLEEPSEQTPYSLYPAIKRMNVEVFIDNTVEKSKIEEVRKKLPALLGMNFSRGDTLQIIPQPWKKITPEDTGLKQIQILKKNLTLIAVTVGLFQAS